MTGALTITAAEANRSFSKLLRAARNGQRVTITSHGEPVAVIGPVREADGGREDALKEMKKRWAKTETVIAPWSRDDIWDEITR